jgi:hypothetical protein
LEVPKLYRYVHVVCIYFTISSIQWCHIQSCVYIICWIQILASVRLPINRGKLSCIFCWIWIGITSQPLMLPWMFEYISARVQYIWLDSTSSTEGFLTKVCTEWWITFRSNSIYITFLYIAQ